MEGGLGPVAFAPSPKSYLGLSGIMDFYRSSAASCIGRRPDCDRLFRLPHFPDQGLFHTPMEKAVARSPCAPYP